MKKSTGLNTTTKEKNNITLFKIIIRVIPLVIMSNPIYFIINNAVGIVHGASHGFNTFVTAKFFETVQNAVTLQTGVKMVILMAVGLGLTAIGVQVLNGVHNFMTGQFAKFCTRHMTTLINKKASRIDPIVFENTDMLDHINKARQGMEHSTWLSFTVVTLFTFYLPYFLFMGVYLYTIKPILAFSLVLIFIPVFFSQLIRGIVFAKLEDKAAPIRREFDYYETTICSRELLKETRLLGGFNFFKNLFTDSVNALSKAMWKAERKTGLLELLMKVITLLGYAGVLYLLVDTLLKGEITIGSFAAVFSSVSLMYGIMEEIIVRHIGSMTKNLATVRNFISFLDLPERKGEVGTYDNSKGIIFDNASFSYPLTTKPTINNVSFSINSGETIAIVGENGAGKSTLVKMLMGIYYPNSGSVTIGGLDTSSISSECIYSSISAVFQNYQTYKMKLSENVAMSSLTSQNDVKETIDKADIDVTASTYPDGYDTVLSKEFDGVDISGGQWQRIAIARGLYKSHEIIVLDEPTAAIDPIEETKIYHKFSQISKGKTSIIVTHRLGSVKIADRIIVMDKGEIAQIGTHEELLSRQGIYSHMWNEQAKFYV